MLAKIVDDFKKLSLDELQKLQAHVQKEIRTRTETRSSSKEVLEEKTVGSTCYCLVKIRCGKKGCRCSRGELHGPYWYAYFRENGKAKCKYVGKTLPDSEAIAQFSERLRKKAKKVRAKSTEIRERAEHALAGARKALSSAPQN